MYTEYARGTPQARSVCARVRGQRGGVNFSRQARCVCMREREQRIELNTCVAAVDAQVNMGWLWLVGSIKL